VHVLVLTVELAPPVGQRVATFYVSA